MKRVLKSVSRNLSHFVGGLKQSGKNLNMSGDCSRLYGDCFGLRGDCSGLRGDLDGAELTDEDRMKGVDIRSLIKN